MKIQSFCHEVISRVPQGTVLDSILFIIMVSEIDENLNSIISRLFAHYIKVCAKIRKHKDTELLQNNLDSKGTQMGK